MSACCGHCFVGGERLLVRSALPYLGRETGMVVVQARRDRSLGTLLLTDRAFFYVHGEPALGKKGYVFAHNLQCYPLTALYRAECRAKPRQGIPCPTLQLVVGGKGGSQLEIPFSSEESALADHWLESLRNAIKRAT